MPSAKRSWFSQEAKRAGRISAVIAIAVFTLLGWIVRSAEPHIVPWFYALSVLSLGAFAVAVLNWRRWHNFRESMQASAHSVVTCLQIIGFVILPIGLLIASRGNPVVFLIIFIVYLLIPLAVYVVVGVPLLVCVVCVVCIGGAALYALLLLMRKMGNVPDNDSHGDEFRSRPLRMLV